MGERLLEWAMQNPVHSPEKAPRRTSIVRAICEAADDNTGLFWLDPFTFVEKYLGGKTPHKLLMNYISQLQLRPYYLIERERQLLVRIHSGTGRSAAARKRSQGREWMGHFLVVAPGVTPDWMAHFVRLRLTLPDEDGNRGYYFYGENLPDNFFTACPEELPDVLWEKVKDIRSGPHLVPERLW